MSEWQPFRRGRPTLQERVDGTAAPLLPRKDTPPARVGDAWEQHQRRLAELRNRHHRDGAPPATGSAKHCWVDDPRWPGRRPGLLLGWDRRPGGWVGRVALVPDGELELAIAFVPSAHLSGN